MKLSWCPDHAAESYLRDRGIGFEISSLPYSKIDMKESQINGARRLGPFVKELVEDYRQAMLDGAVFPMPILHPGKTGWVILSGNQRCAAIGSLIKEGKLETPVVIECYKLEQGSKLNIEVIARAINSLHGGRPDQRERLNQAVYCCRQYGMTMSDAARDFCISKQLIGQHVRAEKERDMLNKSGIDANRLAVTTLNSIGQLPFDSNSKIQVATLAVQHDMPADRVKMVVDDLKKAKTQQARTAKVKELEAELKEQAKAVNKTPTYSASKVLKRPRRDKLMLLCENLVQYLEHGNDGDAYTTLEQLQFTGGPDLERIKKLVGRLSLRWNVLGV